MQIRIITAVVLSLLFSECKKKYPEDPKRTFKSPDKRLRGIWRLQDYYYNDRSVLQQFMGLTLNNFPNDNVLFGYGPESSDEKTLSLDIKYTIRYEDNASFNNKQYLVIGPATDTAFNKAFVSPFHYNRSGIANWEIKKLFDSDLIISLPTDSGSYRIIFKKIAKR